MEWVERVWKQQQSPFEVCAFVVVVTVLLSFLAAILLGVILIFFPAGRAGLARTFRATTARWVTHAAYIEPAISFLTACALAGTLALKDDLIREVQDKRLSDGTCDPASAVAAILPSAAACKAAIGLSFGQLASMAQEAVGETRIRTFFAKAAESAAKSHPNALQHALVVFSLSLLVAGVIGIAWRISTSGDDGTFKEESRVAKSLVLLAFCCGLLWANLVALVPSSIAERAQSTATAGSASEEKRQSLVSALRGFTEADIASCSACASQPTRLDNPDIVRRIEKLKQAMKASPPPQPFGTLYVESSPEGDKVVFVTPGPKGARNERLDVPAHIELLAGAYQVTSKRDPTGQPVRIEAGKETHIRAFAPSSPVPVPTRPPAQLLNPPVKRLTTAPQITEPQ